MDHDSTLHTLVEQVQDATLDPYTAAQNILADYTSPHFLMSVEVSVGETTNMSKRSKPQTIEYAFRFAKGTDTEQARMAEMIRVNLAALIEQVILTHNGEEVLVDGFRLRDEPDLIYALSQSVTQASTTQPATATEGNQP